MYNRPYLKSVIASEDTIFLHGGGNFGDLYRGQTELRNYLMGVFPFNKLILFPQTINYRNRDLIAKDNKLYSKLPDFTIMTRSVESYEFAKKTFTNNKVFLVPDMAFMIGNLKPKRPPIYDIMIFRRADKEKDFNSDEWTNLLENKSQNETRKFSYLVNFS